jgi:uncharacterized protein involved in exopolysaccharide biosynthesis
MSNLDYAHVAPASADYGSRLVVHAALGVWRHKRLMFGILAAALALGMIAVLVIPTRYTAEAHLSGEFLAANPATNEDKTPSIPISLDLSRVIETQSRLLQSHQVALRVVQQIGLERLQPVVNKRPWLPDGLNDSTVKTQSELEAIAAATLLGGLSVRSDPRAYLLTVLYSAEDPELVVLITNAFVAELLRNAKLQDLSQKRAFAEAVLSQHLARFGDKHPRLVNVRMRLAVANDLLKEQLKASPEAILNAAGENVTKAISGTPRPRPAFVIGLLLLVGLVIGIGVALWLERDRWWQPSFRVGI